MTKIEDMNLLVIGGATVDFSCFKTALSQEMVFSSGNNKIDLDSFTIAIGGGGVNTACALAKLGYNTVLLSRVGKDQNGRKVIEGLKRAGVLTDQIQRDVVKPTGVAISLSGIQSRSEALILADRGANYDLRFNDDIGNTIKYHNGIYISALIGHSCSILGEVIGCRRERQAIAINPGTAQIENSAVHLVPYLNDVDVYLSNYAEALSFWCNVNGRAIEKLELRDDFPSIDFLKNFAEIIHSFGPSIVAITLGKNGVFVSSKKHRDFLYPSAAGHVANETGAGDTFGATFFSCVTAGIDIQMSANMALLNAASVVECKDRHAGLRTYSELARRIQNNRLAK